MTNFEKYHEEMIEKKYKAVKNGKPFVKFEPPIIVYDTPSVYTTQLLNIYGGTV